MATTRMVHPLPTGVPRNGVSTATATSPAWVQDRLLQQLDTLLAELHTAFEDARHDSLTGLSNRRAFLERLEAECASAERHGRPLTLVMIDIDDLRAVNGTFGHYEGDRMLRATAECLKGAIRAGDLLARYGGDMFVVLCPDTGRGAATVIASKLRGCMATAAAKVVSGSLLQRVSVGWATLGEGESASSLFQRADAHLYREKHAHGLGVNTT